MFILFVICLIYGVVQGQKPSPCPKVLSYEEKGDETDRWYAVLSIENTENLANSDIRVILDRPAELFGSWFGDTSTKNNQEFIIRNSQYKSQGSPASVRFFVKFNAAQIVPSVEEVKVNRKTICEAEKIVTTIRPVTSSVTNGNIRSGDEKVNGITRLVGNNGTPLLLQNGACGTVVSSPLQLIANAQPTFAGQWPWHAALYFSSSKTQTTYICGGTLISQQHVLTAAHCVTYAGTSRVIDPKQILVFLGKYTLSSFGPEVQLVIISDIIVHPRYNNTMYFNDLAVLKLSRPVQITNFVRPCCLWEEETDLSSIVNKEGTVVGWGLNKDEELSNELMQSKMPIVSIIRCIESNRAFFYQVLFENNFCAGYANGTSVCNGDSGGGLVFPKRGTTGANTVWQIRGVVSIGVPQQGRRVCDTKQFALFTDVAKYVDWIKRTID